MARQDQLERTAERKAIDRRSPRLAAGLDAAEDQRQAASFLEQRFVRRFLALGLQQVGEDGAHGIQHRQIGAAGEGILARGDDDALHGGIRRGLLDDVGELFDHALIEHVHRLAGAVPGDKRNAVGVGLNLEVLVSHVRLSNLLLTHDLVRNPASAFRDHARRAR